MIDSDRRFLMDVLALPFRPALLRLREQADRLLALEINNSVLPAQNACELALKILQMPAPAGEGREETASVIAAVEVLVGELQRQSNLRSGLPRKPEPMLSGRGERGETGGGGTE